MNTVQPTDEEIKTLVSEESFQKNYNKVLAELDAVYRGVFDETEAHSMAALCLLAQAGLIKVLARAEQTARSYKRDVKIAEAEAYSRLKDEKTEGKKLTETALTQLINKDEEVNRLYKEQNVAEREAKELDTLLDLLKDAHLTFRALVKKG